MTPIGTVQAAWSAKGWPIHLQQAVLFNPSAVPAPMHPTRNVATHSLSQFELNDIVGGQAPPVKLQEVEWHGSFRDTPVNNHSCQGRSCLAVLGSATSELSKGIQVKMVRVAAECRCDPRLTLLLARHRPAIAWPPEHLSGGELRAAAAGSGSEL